MKTMIVYHMRNIKILGLIIVTIMALSCKRKSYADDALRNETDISGKTLSAKSFSVKSGGFGYDIYSNGELFIHQPNIPGREGVKGFDTEEHALKVAKLVMKKIRKNQMPPTISEEELNTIVE